jgi:hypothetical protein
MIYAANPKASIHTVNRIVARIRAHLKRLSGQSLKGFNVAF